MFDKFKFWKKDDDFSDLDLGLGDDNQTGLDLPSSKPLSPPERPSFDKLEPSGISEMQAPPMSRAMPMMQQGNSNNNNDLMQKELEIISAKLDTIRASIEALNHRMASIEQKERKW